MGTLVDMYEDSPDSYLYSKIVPIMEAYAAFSHKVQHMPNPSGTFEDKLSGLGEPKFNVDGTAFTGNWGRPQRDGPPLRAITLMRYMKAYNASHASLWSDRSNLFEDLYDVRLPANSTIKADLEYTSHYWHESGFDLWEEVNGLHFFTAIVQLRALREGARVALLFADHGATRWYTDQADRLQQELMPRFWNEEKGHIVETLDSDRSGHDCGILLGAIHGTTTECSTNPEEAEQCEFAPYSDEILVSLLELVRDQANRYPINAQPVTVSPYDDISELAGVGVGRYPEDGYNGYETISQTGNPWFLCTSSVSEILYRTHLHLQSTGVLNVTERGLPFWAALIPNQHPSTGVYKKGNDVYEEALRRLKSIGDAFLKVVRTHVDGEGSMSEQFDRVNGFMRGATDLTWSYGAFLQAVRARKMAS
jgi:glucoamylase